MLAFGWQFLTVHSNYQGRWNALFCTGEKNSQPPELASENLYLFTGSQGYDGQMYHYIAHDPFFVRGLDMYLDAPRVRYRRILIPLAAHVLALGRDGRIDAAYIGVILFTIFCGGYWLSLYAAAVGFHPALGFSFLLIPAVLISIDRLTVDVALAALCIALALLVSRESRYRLYGVLLAAPLVRETGFLLVAGYVLSLLWKRRLRSALFFATAALPALAWYAFVQLQTSSEDIAAFSRIPFQGIALRMATPYQYPFGPAIAAISTILDYAALAAIALAVALAIRMGFQRLAGPVEFGIYCFVIFAAFLFSPGAWAEVYAFGRTLSPLLILLGIYGLSKRYWIFTLPLLLVVPRTVIQLGPQVIGVFRKVL
ncbi:MAG TPA: hypothetical protein VEV17_05280 [Bryobacteraceae bacterium]|nr:hypothetical protein [Bryobacteraceae bacterium]